MSEVIDFLRDLEQSSVKVKEYLGKGVDVNVKDNAGANFAIKYAARQRKKRNGKCASGIQLLEELLLCPNLDVNNKDWEGKTAFMWSCINGSWEVAERLLTVPGVDLNHRDKLGMTAFMWSCFYGRKEIVELLLKNPMSD